MGQGPGPQAPGSGMMYRRIDTAGQGIFAANGTATIQIPGPDFGHTWTIDQISVQSTSTSIPKAQVYKNSPVTPNYISGTLYAIQDTDSAPNTQLMNGDQIVVTAQNGTPGSQLAVRITGTDYYYPRAGAVQ